MNPLSDQRFELILLGGFEAHLNGQPVAGISYLKMRTLLAYLAMEREQEHSRELLAELLWRDNDPVTARGNLRRTLSHLRSALELPTGMTLFSATKHTIRFIPNIYVDALDFNQPLPTPSKNSALYHEERIINLYQGQFLAGLSLPDSPEFEAWLQLQREALHRRALALLEQLSNRYAQTGDYARALQFALRHIELEPWDESGHRRVMRIYALNGQKNSAIRQYEICYSLIKQELGVLPSEETRQLIKYICNSELQRRSTDNPAQTPTSKTLSLPAERRQATVLYCELSVAKTDDSEAIMQQLQVPQLHCLDIIRQLSGYIVQLHGGGLLAYFGYPHAREDAACRALQAALAITDVATEGVGIRVGVHTGLIITGGDISLPDTVGKTSKQTIQLCQYVDNGEVAISRYTQRLVAGYVDCISLGLQKLTAFSHAVEIFKARQYSEAGGRFNTATPLTRLAGRQNEMAELMTLWQGTRQGLHHALLIQGEAGIGKSRLLQTLKQQLTHTAQIICELHCFAEFSQSPFYSLIALLNNIFAFAHHDLPAVKFDKLAQYVNAHYPSLAENAIPLLSQLLSLPCREHNPTPALSLQQQKQRIIAIFVELLRTLSTSQPVLLIVEDLHRIDPSSLEILTLLVEREKTSNVFALFTARPEFILPWQSILSLTLTPLSDDDVETMLTSLAHDISAETRQDIIRRADGIPLFVEEIAKMTHADKQTAIPLTLYDLLAARIDSVGEVKYTAQLAATLGHEFNLDVLSKIFSGNAATLTHSLKTLQEAGLIVKINDSTYQFRHVLIQEVAYQSQTKTDRQALHQRIAQTLQVDFPDLVRARPELLAQHLYADDNIRPIL